MPVAVVAVVRERCPKCGGNLYEDKDVFGKYLQCLQCGCTHDLPDDKQITQTGEEPPEFRRHRGWHKKEGNRMTKAEAGRLGGLSTKNKYGLSFYSINGKRGGRPRALTLAETQSQFNSRKQKEIKERKDRLPTSSSIRTMRERLKLKIEMGELACCGRLGSPERNG